ncbi:hypothetical protein SAMN05421819_3532 [Bryocella elongata]|uniref:LexA DNA binding domain-containing protein n=1 Tax=Bryocella elongata TaxID=863522 RepID=A0A1H6B697_9BACT|nr:hypothetical protein [Bryocella elongata]SEG55915.1 hypothetical protein SAMN05421819_3532 [Bryocella elongata]
MNIRKPTASTLPPLAPFLQRSLVAYIAVRERKGDEPSLSEVASELGKSKGHANRCMRELVLAGCLLKMPPPVRHAPYRVTPIGRRCAAKAVANG